ncbi:MAG: DNA-processing protein DprA [Clostridia bacterium]|nr:DNA-processing protein DprA [Clostridia bacterium]
MNEELAWYAISKVNEISYKQIEDLLKLCQKPQKIFKLSKEKLINFKLNEQQCKQILETKFNELILEQEKLKQDGIKFITKDDKLYPENLKNIFDPPYWIYIKGNAQTLNKRSVAIIGSRNCSKYGENVSKRIAYYLAKQDICVVSGLARGIDTKAHEGCVIGNGTTIAVLGSGLNNIYPQENIPLYSKIIEKGGAIISEYPMDEKPSPENFPKRNRIISGLSEKIIVVEAGKRSGTFITVDFALEQGKEIYAVPGNITSINSAGTNNLIKEGAIPLTDLGDLEF